MIQFPGSKINIGLNILRKREDGFHEIESVFYPVRWSDIVEVVPSDQTKFTTSGLSIPGEEKDNLCLRAAKAIDPELNHPVHIHLHKVVPMGAGLGGGSADGAAVLTLMNEMFDLGNSNEEMMNLSASLGSDCPFFVNQEPHFVQGRGEKLEKIDIDLSDKYIVIVHPGVHVSTGEAYAMAEKGAPVYDLKEAIQRPIEEWQGVIKNGFENPMIDKFPEIRDVRDRLLSNGALYASMTGSGSAVFGIFENRQEIGEWPENYAVWTGSMAI